MLLLNIQYHRGNGLSLPFTLPDHRTVKINCTLSYDFRKNSEQLVVNTDWKNCSHVVRLCPVNTDSRLKKTERLMRDTRTWISWMSSCLSNSRIFTWKDLLEGRQPILSHPIADQLIPNQLIALSTADQPQQVTLLTPHYREQTSSSSLIHKRSLFPFTR